MMKHNKTAGNDRHSNNKWKKTCAVLLIAVLAALTLAGCSSGSSSKSASGSTGSSSSASTDAGTGGSAREFIYVDPSDLSDSNSGSADSNTDEQTRPEIPDGQNMPELPEGQEMPEMPNGQPPNGFPGGDSSNGSFPGGSSNGSFPGGGFPGGSFGGGANTQEYDYKGTNTGTLTADGTEQTSEGETIDSSEADKNAVLAVNGATLTVKNATITKSGDDTNGDNCNFYGLNSSVLAVGESTRLYLSESKISSTSEGSNGVFATDGARVFVNDTEITTTTGGNSRGLDATYGGVIYGNALTISTEKDHCATLATDRGGGYISVTNSDLSTKGSGSPLIYSTGDIEVDNVTGTSSGSQIAGMEGYNRIIIYNSTLESTNDAISGSDPIKNGVILYQSMSGDADTSTSQTAIFNAADSTLKTSITDGAMFYVTNTTARVVLDNTKLDFDSSKVDLINASGNDSNGWGTAGKNGGRLIFTGISQELSGNITADTISSIDFYLTNGSTWTGAASIVENSNGSTSEAPITINIDGTSKWTVAADTTISALNAEDGAAIVDGNGKTVTIVANGETVVEGESDITVTVTGAYGTAVATGESNELSMKVLDRTNFDKTYGTSTSFGTNSKSL